MSTKEVEIVLGSLEISRKEWETRKELMSGFVYTEYVDVSCKESEKYGTIQLSVTASGGPSVPLIFFEGAVGMNCLIATEM